MSHGRALLVILDSVGMGGAADAAAYGDAGADTLRHIAQACARGEGDRAGLRAGPLALPHLAALGLGRAADLSSGGVPPGLETGAPPRAAWGYAVETSKGKDTPSGHWEIAGQPITFDWGYFPDARPAFPAALTDALIREADLPGILGDRHASGTAIIAELGEAHVRTGAPICYTSVDSVFQIAAHEESFGLERLYATCRIARRLCDPYRIGRVIARPFEGASAEDFRRTPNRRDFSVPPPMPTLLDHVVAAGGRVFAIGKIADIFGHRGVTDEIKADGNHALLDAALAAFAGSRAGDLTIVNLIDFDQLHGHRRDVAGYAAALEAFDARVPEIEAALEAGDLCVITADHGNDPTWRGTDHTREHVPILAMGGGAPRPLGRRPTFADIGATLADHLGLPPLPVGESWLAR